MTDLLSLLSDQRLLVTSAIEQLEDLRALFPPPPNTCDWSGAASQSYGDVLGYFASCLADASSTLHSSKTDLDAAIGAVGLCLVE